MYGSRIDDRFAPIREANSCWFCRRRWAVALGKRSPDVLRAPVARVSLYSFLDDFGTPLDPEMSLEIAELLAVS